MTTATLGKKEQAAKSKRASNRNGHGRPETMEEIGLGDLIPGTPIEPETIAVEAAKKKSTPAKGKPAPEPEPEPAAEPEAPSPKRIRRPKPKPKPEPEAPENAPEAPAEVPAADPVDSPEQAPEAPHGEPEAPAEAPAPEAPGAWGPPKNELATWDPWAPGNYEHIHAPDVVALRSLSPEEQADLDRCEGTIAAGFASFVPMGLAMAEVLAKGLYGYKYTRFEDYVEDRWGYTERQAYYLISSASEVRRLEALGLPSGDLPTTLRAARELTRVPEEDREAVIKAANDLARSRGKERAGEAEVKASTEVTGKRTGKKGAKQPDEVIPREVARAQRNGTIPEGTTIEVTQVNPDVPDLVFPTPEQVFDRAKYLDQFPIRESLGKNQLALFDAEAMVYHEIEASRLVFIREHTAPAFAREQSALHRLGPYSVRLQYALKLPDPSKWVLCESCNGSGEGEIMGKVVPCNDCKENGFHVRSEKYARATND
jgi:hypothetical protein